PGHNGVFAPKGLPAEIRASLEKACAAAVRSPTVAQATANTSQTIRYLTGAEFQAQTVADHRFKGELIRRLGLEAKWSMIPKSGCRFSEKIMLHENHRKRHVVRRNAWRDGLVSRPQRRPGRGLLRAADPHRKIPRRGADPSPAGLGRVDHRGG